MKKYKLVCAFIVILVAAIAPLSIANASPLYIGGPGGPGVSPGEGGSVTSSGGINCGSNCTGDLTIGASTVLTFNPAASVAFDSWSLFGGSCSEGTSSAVCTFTAGSYGSFAAQPYWHFTSYNISVTKSGDGTGTVTGSGGINCGSVCSVAIPLASGSTGLTFTASPNAGSTFVGWDASSTYCVIYSGGGKASMPVTNPSPNCSDILHVGTSRNKIIKAIFGKAAPAAAPAATTTSIAGNSSSAHVSNPTASSAPQSAADAIAASASGPVSLKEILVAGKAVDTSKPVEFKQTEPLILSGKTTPNGIVTLTIHSTPRTVTTKADKNGNWSYTVKGLEPGNHSVEASVKDPSTKQESSKSKILSFTVKAVSGMPSATTTPKLSKHASKIPLVIAVFAVSATMLAIGFWIYKKKHTAIV